MLMWIEIFRKFRNTMRQTEKDALQRPLIVTGQAYRIRRYSPSHSECVAQLRPV